MMKPSENAQLAATARLFSSTVLQELARRGESPCLSRLLVESGLASTIAASAPLRGCFDLAFKFLRKRAHRYEYVYRAAITHKLLLGVHSLSTASMLSEFRVAACKADLVILNGTSTVYEIKSERDNLDRLATQVAEYFKAFVRVNVITAEAHVEDVLNLVPPHVGVVVLSDRFQISTVRESQEFNNGLCSSALLDSLQQQEALQIIDSLGLARPAVPNTRIRAEMRKIFAEISPLELHRCMIEVLKKSRSLLPLSELAGALPSSLKPMAFLTEIRKSDHERLIRSLDTAVAEALTWA
jgi:hypothetical protein